MRVLVVDDMMESRELLARYLRQWGHEVILANDGVEALEVLGGSPISMVITDWLMPRMDGVELCRKIRSQSFPRYIYILMVTVRDSKAELVTAMSAGADDYIAKPFDKDELSVRIRAGERILDTEQRLIQLNELKNKFLGIAAHDLRNPLSVMRGFAELLLDPNADPLTEGQREFISVMHTITNEMLTLVNDLLDISAIEAGQLDLKLVVGNMDELIEERVRMSQVMAANKKIVIHLECERTPPILFDRRRIGQVIDNLISNAVKFSQPGAGIYVRVAQGEGVVQVSVRDEGPGISVEEQKRLFGEFQKLSALPTGDEVSTGLGLAIVKKIVDAHGGTVQVASQIGEGSIFGFSVPVRMEEKETSLTTTSD